MTDIQDVKYKICTLLLIQNDCETLKNIVLKFRDPIFCMEIIPYMALFCRSFQEYYGMELISKDVDSEIYDIRNSIKIYGDRYGKSKKKFLVSDESQDEEFREQLRFDFTKNLDIHYNLGMYFTDDMKIIGNTQLIANTLNMNELSQKERGEKAYNLGYHLGSIIGGVSRGLASTISTPRIQLNENMPTFYYDDINTNKNNFFNPTFGKDISLFMLHVLCSINFIKYVLEPLFSGKNVWMLRIKYIVIYHTYLGMGRLKAYIENNRAGMIDLIDSIDVLLQNGDGLFTSKFRNCMMHYNLENNGEFAISDVNFDENKLFYGLIEECFKGESYISYFNRISWFGDQIEEYLSQHFDFDVVCLKEL